MSKVFERSTSFNSMRSPSLSRTTSGRACQQSSGNAATVVAYTLATVVCVLLFVSTWNHRASQSTAAGKLGQYDSRTRQKQQLEVQLMRREQEVEELKTQLERVRESIAQKEASIQAQDSIVRVLQQRYESERQARSKAQWALADRAQAYDNCLTHKRQLEKELMACKQEMDALKGELKRKGL